MCVIVYSESGKKVPDEIFDSCWAANDDGGGIMFPDKGKVIVQKGFMEKNKLFNAMNSVPHGRKFAVHFRIGTSGGNVPAMTHPFQITPELAMCHNGIITGLGCQSKSDTAKLAAAMKLLTPDSFKLEGVLRIMDYLLQGSRLCLMHGDGQVDLLGDTWSEDDGFWFSNTNWKYRTTRTTYSYSSWDEYYPSKKSSSYPPPSGGMCDDCGGQLVSWGNDIFCEECGRSQMSRGYAY